METADRGSAASLAGNLEGRPIATRSRTSFQKRQKEIARMEKQRDKAAKRAQRKLARQVGASASDDIEHPDNAGAEDAASEISESDE